MAGLDRILPFAVAAIVLAYATAPHARSARCTTTDDGTYPCDFKATNKDGSFQITAPEKPLYILNIDNPGKAFGFVNLGNRNVSLPGEYVRSKTDPACWVNDSTPTQICVR